MVTIKKNPRYFSQDIHVAYFLQLNENFPKIKSWLQFIHAREPFMGYDYINIRLI